MAKVRNANLSRHTVRSSSLGLTLLYVWTPLDEIQGCSYGFYQCKKRVQSQSYAVDQGRSMCVALLLTANAAIGLVCASSERPNPNQHDSPC